MGTSVCGENTEGGEPPDPLMPSNLPQSCSSKRFQCVWLYFFFFFFHGRDRLFNKCGYCLGHLLRHDLGGLRLFKYFHGGNLHLDARYGNYQCRRI